MFAEVILDNQVGACCKYHNMNSLFVEKRYNWNSIEFLRLFQWGKKIQFKILLQTEWRGGFIQFNLIGNEYV